MVIDAECLFEDRMDDISILTYIPRPKRYSAVRENDGEHVYKVGWGGLDLFNLTYNEWIEKIS